MFIHHLDGGDVLVRLPRHFQAWRVDGRHLEHLRRMRRQFYFALPCVILIAAALGAHSWASVLIGAGIMLWMGWKLVALRRWLATHGTPTDYFAAPPSRRNRAIGTLVAVSVLLAFLAVMAK